MSERNTTSLSPSIPFGYCECGCGQPAPLSPYTNKKRGYIAGQPLRFVQGHNGSILSPKFAGTQAVTEYRAWWEKNAPVPYGFCWCGCGNKTATATRNRDSPRLVRGEPRRYVAGHQGGTGLGKKRFSTRYLLEDRGHSTPCWIWQGAKDAHGYGRVGVSGTRRTRNAYAVYYEEEYGTVPAGLELDHLCRQPSCVRPDHLEPVTHTENLRRGKRAKIDQGTADSIRRAREEAELTYSQLAKAFNTTEAIVGYVVRGETWTQ